MLEACPSMCMMDLDYLLCVCQCSPSASVLVNFSMYKEFPEDGYM